MLKLNSLRVLLERCLPDLERAPENLIITGTEGQAVCTGTSSLSFEYRYTARIIVLDYTGHADAVLVPILAWMQVNQSEQMDNPATRERAVQFRVEPLNSGAMDVGIELQLTERAIVQQDPAAGPDTLHRLRITHPEEPALLGTVRQTERWELWLRDEKLLAAWELNAPPARAWFEL
jgi:hypothetical protein